MSLFKFIDLFLFLLVCDLFGDMEGILVLFMEVMVSGVVVLFIVYSGIFELIIDGEFGFLVFEKDSGVISWKIVEISKN